MGSSVTWGSKNTARQVSNSKGTKMKWWILALSLFCLSMAVFPEVAEASGRDSDGDGTDDIDGTPDSHDTDDDGDGVPDEDDEDRDTDGDGTPDIDDTDDDNDGQLDSEDYDDDGDGIPDTEDEDHPDFDDENDEL